MAGEQDINRRRVIAARHYGWERASAVTLGRIFGMTYQAIHAELRRAVCKVCFRAVCTHSDAEYAGAEPMRRGQHITQTERPRVAPGREPAGGTGSPPLSLTPPVGSNDLLRHGGNV